MKQFAFASLLLVALSANAQTSATSDSFETKRGQCRQLKDEIASIENMLERDWHSKEGRRLRAAERQQYRDQKQELHTEVVRLQCGALR